MSPLPSQSPEGRLRLALAVLGLTACVSAVTISSPPGDGRDLLRASLHQAAERLVALQRPDGTWPRDAEGPGELAASGRPALALLRAHGVHPEPRWLAAAERTADALAAQVGRAPRVATPANLLFLSEHGQATGRPELVALAASVRRQQLRARGLEDPVAAADELMGRRNRTGSLDGAWRNYLLWHAGEVAALARSTGDTTWASQFTLAVAESWAPKHDHSWWAMGAGRMLEELSRVPGSRARRLAAVHLAALRNNELRPGIPWGETPYDRHVHALEAAAALRGMLASRDPEARPRAIDGLHHVARQQAPHGGWAAVLPVLDGPPLPGERIVTDPALAEDESPDLDAELLAALARALDPHARAVPMT